MTHNLYCCRRVVNKNKKLKVHHRNMLVMFRNPLYYFKKTSNTLLIFKIKVTLNQK